MRVTIRLVGLVGFILALGLPGVHAHAAPDAAVADFAKKQQWSTV